LNLRPLGYENHNSSNNSDLRAVTGKQKSSKGNGKEALGSLIVGLVWGPSYLTLGLACPLEGPLRDAASL
jgi:hypothetical protein